MNSETDIACFSACTYAYFMVQGGHICYYTHDRHNNYILTTHLRLVLVVILKTHPVHL